MKVYCHFKDERIKNVYRTVISNHHKVTRKLKNADVAVVDTDGSARNATWYSKASIILHIIPSGNFCVVAYLRPDKSTIERHEVPLDFSLPYAGVSTILRELAKAKQVLTQNAV